MGPFRIGIEIGFTVPRQRRNLTRAPSLCEVIATKDCILAPSARFKRLTRLIGELPHAGDTIMPSCISVRLVLQVKQDPLADLGHVFFQVLQVAAVQNRLHTRASIVQLPRLAITQLQLRGASFVESDMELRYIDELRREGIWCSQVDVFYLDTETRPHFVIQQMQRLLATTASAPNGYPGVEKMRVAHPIYRRLVRPLQSAMAASTSLQHLVLGKSDISTDVASIWQWLALVLTKRANPLHHLQVCISSLLESNIASLRRAIESTDLLCDLVGVPGAASCTTEATVVATSTVSVAETPSLLT